MGGALEARGINASGGNLTSQAVGDIEKDGRVLIVKRIHVDYRLKGAAEDQREAAERAHEFHAQYCPVARSIEDSIEITTALEFVD